MENEKVIHADVDERIVERFDNFVSTVKVHKKAAVAVAAFVASRMNRAQFYTALDDMERFLKGENDSDGPAGTVAVDPDVGSGGSGAAESRAGKAELRKRRKTA